jgi:hypothetical protein
MQWKDGLSSGKPSGRKVVIPDVTGSPTDSGYGPRHVLRVDGGNTSNCRSALRVTDLRQWAN